MRGRHLIPLTGRRRSVSTFSLWPHQEQALAAISTAFFEHGQNRLLLQSATGTGKTTVFASMLHWGRLQIWRQQFPAEDRRVLIIAHREELLDQAAERIKRLNPGVMVSVEQGDRRAHRYSEV